MDHQTIKSYLVKLGFAVDKGEASKFSEAIKKSATDAERFAKDLTKSFAAAGLAVVGTLAAVGVGLVDLFASSANADLKFQILGRRMLTTTSVAREMSIALDAMGVSLEDIIGGPPELGQRYTRLIAYQQGLEKALLGPNFEESMYKIRMVEEEFTKAKIAAQYLGMAITDEVVERLTGTHSLDDALKEIDAYLTPEKIKSYADAITNVLVPGLEKMGKALEWIFSKQHIDLVINASGDAWDRINMLYNFLKDPDKALMGSGGIWDTDKGFWNNMQFMNKQGPGFTWNPQGEDSIFKSFGASDRKQLINKIVQMAHAAGVDPNALLTIGQMESGLNPNAPMGGAGEIGMFQVKPKTGAGYGFNNLNNLDQNIGAAIARWKEGMRLRGGDEEGAAEYYNRSVPNDASRAYGQKFKQGYGQWGYATVQPQSYNLNMGGITVNVDKSNASAQEIALQVREEVAKDQQNMWRQLLVNSQGVHA